MKLIYNVSLLLICIALFGCATSQLVGTGTVVNQLQLKKVDYVPQAGTDVGTVAGAGVGVAGGTVLGVGVTIATFGLAAPLIPAFAVAGGAVGGTTGAATGYAHDVLKQGNGLYDYVVKLDDSQQKMVVRQYAMTNISKNDRVKVIKENGVLKIEKIN